METLEQDIETQMHVETKGLIEDCLSAHRYGDQTENQRRDTKCAALFRSVSVEIPLTNFTPFIDEDLMERIEDIFARLDRNGDESLSIEEIMPFFKEELGLPHESIETLFHEIDTNQDNQI